MDDNRLLAGRYRLITRLGSGGMGVVWQAYDERLHRTVAVKQLLLPAGLTETEADDANRKAMREGRIAARFQHPHAVMVYDVDEHEGQPLLVMEYLPSKSLSTVLSEHGPLPPDEVARIGARVAAALAAAHAAGVVHRDVKPGNVLLGDDGEVKITDFGISRAVEDVTGTATNIIAGTPAYLSPEVAQGHKATFSSDVFSLGSTLYAAVEGAPPFGMADNAIALLYRVASGQITPPTEAGPLTDVLYQLLRAEPAHRPTMAQASDALAAVAAGPPATEAAPPAPPPPSDDDPPEPAQTPADETPAPAEPADEEPTELIEARPALVPGLASQDPPSGRTGENMRRKRPTALAAALIALLAVAGTVLVLLFNRDSPGRAAASGQPTATASQVQPAPTEESTTATSGDTATAPTSTASPPGVPVNPPAAGLRDTPDAYESAITDYYALMPGNLPEGWTRLTPRYQVSPAGGYTGYQNFWNQMRSVQVSDVTATQSRVVNATIQYNFKSGKVVRERHTYWLVAQDGRWAIDRSAVISSVTL